MSVSNAGRGCKVVARVVQTIAQTEIGAPGRLLWSRIVRRQHIRKQQTKNAP
jgi:hypothetical protein